MNKAKELLNEIGNDSELEPLVVDLEKGSKLKDEVIALVRKAGDINRKTGDKDYKTSQVTKEVAKIFKGIEMEAKTGRLLVKQAKQK